MPKFTAVEAELEVEAGVLTATPACFPLYTEEKNGKANRPRSQPELGLGSDFFLVTCVTLKSHLTFLVCSVLIGKQRLIFSKY